MQDEPLAAARSPADLKRAVMAALVGLVYFFPVIWMILRGVQDPPGRARDAAEIVLHPDARALLGLPSIGFPPTALRSSTLGLDAISPTAFSFH